MPRTATVETAPPSLIASAVRYAGDTTRIYQASQDWQREAWRFYDITGELRFAANWIANVLSRAALVAAKRNARGDTIDAASPKAIAAMDALFAGCEGQAAMLSALGLHLTVAGEAYIVGRTITAPTGETIEKWEVIGVQEMRNAGNTWTIDYGSGQRAIQLADDDVIIRVWRPHPRRRIEADSPVRALLPVLTELEYLTRHVFAQVTSRLAGAGLLILPQGMSFPPASNADPTTGDVPANSATAFMQTLGEAMLTPIKEPSNASALVPIVVTVPDDLVDKANLIHFWSDLDSHAIEMRTEAIRRFALGMDMPPEVVLGLAVAGSSANHWTSWQIEESAIKVNIEPLLQLITDALTDGYLVPATGDITDVITSDTSDIRLRPDRSKEAFELYDRGEIDGEALRRENGFDEDDAPSPEEYKLWLLRKVASGSASPEQVSAALAQLGIAIPPGDIPTNEARPDRTLNGHPTRDIPDGPNPPNHSQALIAAADVLVFRALERAGNRLRSQTGSKPPCGAADTYLHVTNHQVPTDYLLADAWGCVGQVADGLGVDSVRMTACLDAYCRDLLDKRRPHERRALASYFTLAAMP